MKAPGTEGKFVRMSEVREVEVITVGGKFL
jgi:hypothetical protein